MAIVKDSIEIMAKPEKIFDGLIEIFSSQENFKNGIKIILSANGSKESYLK